MTIRTNVELSQLLNAAANQYDQVRVLDTALTATKRIKAKRVASSATAQEDVWATGTLFRDCALVGGFTFADNIITDYGDTNDVQVALAADLATGKSVLRIEGGGHWVEGTVGLTGSGADFIVAENPTTTNSFAFAPTMRIYATASLPNGIPDSIAPEITLAVSSNSITSAGNITLTATATDNVAVTSVIFYKDGQVLGTKNGSPWTWTEALTYVNNGTAAYTARAYDANGNNTLSAAQNVTINIAEPVETGPATAVGAELTTIGVQNTSASTITNVPLSFGQVFKVGALPSAGAFVDLNDGTNTILCQLNVKATHPDGSVRHAVISAIIPSIAANATVTYSIRRQSAGATGTAAVPADFAGLNATATIVDTGVELAGPTAGTTYTADAAALLAAGTYETWLSGPIVSEWILRVPLKTAGNVEHPDLHARFHIQAFKGQAKARIHYIIENSWAKEKAVPSGTSPWEDVSITDKIYTCQLKAGTTTVYTRATNGLIRTRLNYNSSGTYDSYATGVPNTSTAYTATFVVDGVTKNISMVGSTIQTYGQLKSAFNTQLGGMATCTSDDGNLGLKFVSATTGASSSVVITDYGTLFPALTHITPYRPIRGDEIVHYSRQRWKKTFWWNATEPTIHLIHNKVYLMASKALPNYKADLTGDTTTITNVYNSMKANEDIGQNGITKAYMGDVGFAPGIGILPEWVTMWLISQSKDAKYTMMKQADLLGSWPAHVREYGTDDPILFSDWPYATISPNDADSTNSATGLREKLPSRIAATYLPVTRNIPDVAHHPDMCFVPYLITGDAFYMESMLFYQRYILLNQNAHANYRDGRKCRWFKEQPRGQAWLCRSAAHTLYLLPDNHPARADIIYEMDQNKLWYETNHVSTTGTYHNNFGFFQHELGLNYNVGGAANTGGAPWMDDFITSAFGRAIELGFTKFTAIFNYKAKCPVGRLTSGPDFCWQVGAAYRMQFRATSSSALYTTWAQVYNGSATAPVLATQCGTQAMADALAANHEGTPATINTMTGYPTAIGGYPSNMQPALAYAATLGAPGGTDAWQVFENRSLKPNYNTGAQFAIEPRI